jgi:CheY-like chemotaxis protein
VLLVEDEPLIRLSTADILAGLGHSVDEAGNAAEALALLDKHDFDVLITDLRLPGIGGDELAVQAIARQPELRIVFASGYEVLPKREGREELAGAVLLPRSLYGFCIVDAQRSRCRCDPTSFRDIFFWEAWRKSVVPGLRC